MLAAEFNSPFQMHYCMPSWSWQPPPLRDYDLWCVLGGRGELELAGRAHSLSAGSCFLLRPGDAPRGSHDPAQPLVVFAGHFNVRGVDFPPPWTPGPVQVADVDVLETAARLLLHFQDARDRDTRGMNLALAQLLHLVEPAEQETPANQARRRLQQVVEVLDRDLGGTWTIERMARLAGLSRAQLHRLWVQAFGRAPMQSVVRRRVDRAQTLLRESGMTLEQIAEGLGYSDVHYFSRQFHQQTGQRPGAVRRLKAFLQNDTNLPKNQ